MGYCHLMALIFCLMQLACTDSSFLDAVPNKSLVIPHTLDDYQAILDNDRFMNGSVSSNYGVTPALGDMGADDYVLLESFEDHPIMDNEYANIYTWQSHIFERSGIHGDWTEPYRTVLYANMVLNGIKDIHITENDRGEYEKIRGSALFYRAHAFYQLAQIFAPPYPINENASLLLGIPLRLDSDINEPLQIANLEDTYQRIILDLEISIPLLPEKAQFNTRPSKAASHALLARTYLVMHQYQKAKDHADSCLMIKDDLLDYNEVLQQSGEQSLYPFGDARENKEIIFSSLMVNQNANLKDGFFSVTPATLLNQYGSGDLRKTLYFHNEEWGITYSGSYSNNNYYQHFSGLATDEIYLVRAEAKVRLGDHAGALDDLNSLLIKRHDATFNGISASSSLDILDAILSERRKELLMRGLRWTDLRRLNEEGYNITISRKFRGRTYSLPPNDPRYTYPIPPNIMVFNPTWPQNAR